jgi:hypothetical protein
VELKWTSKKWEKEMATWLARSDAAATGLKSAAYRPVPLIMQLSLRAA